MSASATSGFVTDMNGLRDSGPVQLGHSDWAEMTQEQVNTFADLTGDHNPIHVDPERARSSVFGTTVAHGMLSLSLLATVTQRLQVTDAGSAVNYGTEKVRFPAPLRVGDQWRGGAEVVEVSEIKGGLQARVNATVEVKDSERPAAVAEFLIRFYP
jgi:acyl dehydratase